MDGLLDVWGSLLRKKANVRSIVKGARRDVWCAKYFLPPPGEALGQGGLHCWNLDCGLLGTRRAQVRKLNAGHCNE